MENIIIKGAKEHNLKNIDVVIPRNKLTVISGLSGSGKSTLAFDTIYAEGQRRYVESLSTYARQFLGILNKPDVEFIEGLSPAIAIDQKTTSRNPRSTVGTVTEIYDYFRLLFAKVGDVYCPQCGQPINRQTTSQITDSILKNYKPGTKIAILSPVVRNKKGEQKQVLEMIQKQGFVRMRIDGNILSIADNIIIDPNKKHNIDIVVDRIQIEDFKKENEKDEQRMRIYEAVELAVKYSNGYVISLDLDTNKEIFYSENFACVKCDISLPEITPKTFSFNSPQGACPKCHGLGMIAEFDISLLIPNPSLSIAEGVISPLNHYSLSWISNLVENVAQKYGIDIYKPFNKLTQKERDFILYGSKDNESQYKGVIKYLQDKYNETDSDSLKEYLSSYTNYIKCDLCNGTRLKKEALAIKINGKNIIEVTAMSIKDAYKFFNELKFNDYKKQISDPILKEIIKRLQFLSNVGLDYLTLDRSAATLSGGESQRIRLATQVGLKLTGVLYVLDEPSIGLHPRDNDKLLNTIIELKNLDNTVIVVEHDEETIMKADYVIDMGPKAGKYGGQIIAQGTPQEIINNKNSITGDYLSGRKSILVPSKRRKINLNRCIEIFGASFHNLKNIDVKIPLNVFVGVCGVSGSGKSSLINGILVPALMQKVYKQFKYDIGDHKKISGLQFVDKIISINQEPIGRTPRSNPATYTGIFDDIRNLFASTKEAQARGYKSGRFSFNVKGGRCEACKGDGLQKIEMHFLPDVYVKCEVCNGKRYNKETLEILYKGKNISEVLEMTVLEALEFFENIPSIHNKLLIMRDVGLDYIHLGQSATTLSGGEAQRIKLSTELSKKHTGNTVYVLDEPTTGLHFADIEKLLNILQKLVDLGNTVIVIEHNLDVLKCCDYLIDLGPEGGDEGGYLVCSGTPEEISKCKNSYTGQYLKKKLNK